MKKQITKKVKEVHFLDQVFYKSSSDMAEVPDESVQLIVTSPPYFNIKDYSKDGHQTWQHSARNTSQDFGNIDDYSRYIDALLKVWQECERVLKPNGKLCINAPLLPMLKKCYSTHYNRHIFDLNSDIQSSILDETKLFLLDLYIWNRTNPTKKLMFGSYPYPRNFYAQNTTEFISVYVKDGKPDNNIFKNRKRESSLTQKEWIEFTKQVWNIPIPKKSDVAFGKHAAIMPEEIPYRCIRLFTFVGDVVLDPFAGSGTTLKVAKDTGRRFVGYEVYSAYRALIEEKIQIRQENVIKYAVNQ